MESGEDARLGGLFARYRDCGDHDALARVVEDATPWLVRRSRRWFRAVADREDALQETFLRAMARAPRWHADRPLLPWLLGILRLVAAEQRRRLGRIAPLTVDVAGDAERPLHAQEAARAVEAALQALPTSYREIVRRRLVCRERVVDIARAMAMPVATARSQLQRGMRMLRQALPHGLSLAAFAAMANAGRTPAHRVVRPRAMAVTATGVAAAVAAACLLWPMTSNPARVADGAGPMSVAAAPAQVARDLRAVNDVVAVGTVRAAAPAATVALRGRVGLATAADWRAAEVVARPVPHDQVRVPAAIALIDEASAAELRSQRAAAASPIARAPVGDDGSFVLEVPAQTVVLDVVDRRIGLIEPKLVRVAAGVGQVDVGLLPGYVGRSVRGVAAPALAGAELTAWVEASPWPLRQHTDARAASARPWRVRIGADGDFAVDALPPDGALLLVAEDGQGRRWCSAPAPGDPAATWRFAPGVLAVETSSDTAGGEVVATHTTGFRVVAPLVSGRARLSALPPGAYEVSCRTDRGTVLRARAAVDGCAVCLLRTDGLRHLAGTVVDATGAAVAGAIVEVSAGVDRATTGATATDADGRFTVVVTAAEHALVRWRGQTHRFAVADRREPLRLALAPRRTVRGRLLDRDGAGAEALLTTLWNDGGWLDPAERATVVAADGSFALNDVPEGRLAVGFHTPEGVFYRADVGEGADLGAIAPRLPRALRVRVRDAAGRPVAAPLHVDASPSFVLAGGASALVSGVAPDSDGAIVVPVPCWIERLHVHAADRSATAAIGVGEVVAAGASGAEIRLQPVGRIAGATSKREPGDRWLVVADEAASDAPRVVWAPAQGDFAVEGLRPGCYRLEEWRRGSERPLCRHRVRLAAAATAEVDAPPARALRVAIDGLPDGATVSIGVDDAIATTIANRTGHDVCLPAGEHVVTCRAASGERLGLSRRVVIATSGADVDLAFRLPGGRLFGCAPSAFATSAIQVLPHAPSWLPATLSPDADGRFLLAHVDPNACTLYCVASDGGAAAVAPAATGEWRCVATARVHWPIGAEGEPLCVRSLDGMPLPLRCEGPVAAVPCGAIVAGWRGRQARFVARPGGVVMLD